MNRRTLYTSGLYSFRNNLKHGPWTINIHITWKTVRNINSWAPNYSLLEFFCALRFQQFSCTLKFEKQHLYDLCFYLLSFKSMPDTYYYPRIVRVEFTWSVSMWNMFDKVLLQISEKYLCNYDNSSGFSLQNFTIRTFWPKSTVSERSSKDLQSFLLFQVTMPCYIISSLKNRPLQFKRIHYQYRIACFLVKAEICCYSVSPNEAW